jgi:sterol 3beta-glucosyltransferase
MLPIRDILSAQQCKAFQFGCYGLLIVIKGHEELFFEFRGAQRRASCIELLERQIELSRNPPSGDDNSGETALDSIILEELEPTDLVSSEDPHPPSETLLESLPAVMFTSASSTFLSFKPQTPLRFTFLTIGSRGDVQPYIALAKGLMADGHKIKIATHEEYKDWVTSVGAHFYEGTCFAHPDSMESTSPV